VSGDLEQSIDVEVVDEVASRVHRVAPRTVETLKPTPLLSWFELGQQEPLREGVRDRRALMRPLAIATPPNYP
jgi:hypothetical protein